MQMEFQEPIKGTSSSSAPSTFPSASAPQQYYYGTAGNNFNYQQEPQPTMGILAGNNFNYQQAPQPTMGILAGNNFNYQQAPQPTIGIAVNVMPNSSHQPPLAAPVPWSTGLCYCYDDTCLCCMTCWCPCVTFGRIAEITDKGSIWCGLSGTLYTILLVIGCSFLYSCCYRSKLRAQYSLEESPCCDCCVHFCCQSCALRQEYRELSKRGFDLSIGWQMNMKRQIRGASVHPPIVQQPMYR